MSDKMFAWFKCNFCTNKFETKRNMLIHKRIDKIGKVFVNENFKLFNDILVSYGEE